MARNARMSHAECYFLTESVSYFLYSKIDTLRSRMKEKLCVQNVELANSNNLLPCKGQTMPNKKLKNIIFSNLEEII